MVRIGSLFSGYGGLDMAAEAITGGKTVWMSDIEKTPSKIIAERWPGVPNLGDITKIDWAGVEPIDVLTGGFPCQDVSSAGRRKGLRPGTRSGLWAHMAFAIDQLRPKLIMIENVRGLLNASATCDVEPCPWCVGEGSELDVRALGTVLGDLAALGYDARWQGFRASDIGAPHERFRVFIAAYPQGDEQRESAERGVPGQPRSDDQETIAVSGGQGGQQHAGGLHSDPERSDQEPADADGAGHGREHGRGLPAQHRGGATEESADPDRVGGSEPAQGRQVDRDAWPVGSDRQRGTGVALLPTPLTTEAEVHGTVQDRLDGGWRIQLVNVINSLMPTPQAEYDARRGKARADDRRAAGRQVGLSDEVNMLPTPSAGFMNTSAGHGQVRPSGFQATWNLAGLAELRPEVWGVYAPAIARWESILGRPAPDPRADDGKLNPAFVEWMMGLPAGWVTELGFSRSTALKALGNGVVPQQAEAAFRFMIDYPNHQEIAA